MKSDSPTRWSNRAVATACLALAVGGYFAGRHIHSKTRPEIAASSIAVQPRAAAGDHAAIASTPAAGESKVANGSWEDRWKELLGERSTPARTKKLAALIAELAKTDPQRALALAQSFGDWRLRDLLRNAAVRGWAEVKPDQAADWALNVRSDERRSVVEALMQGAAVNPGAAVRVALRMCNTDTERAGDYGHYTIGALVENGAFDAALRFGLEVGPDKYPFLLKSALFQWARNQPDAAMAALETIPNPVLRGQARGEAIAGWAWADAKGLTDYAMTLPAGADRAQILSLALPRWVEKDPAAATEWINRFESGAEFDAGISAMANMQSLIAKQPAVAMNLAGGISNPAERAHTMRAVFRQWAQNDLAAAQQFAASASTPEVRELLKSELKDLHPDG